MTVSNSKSLRNKALINERADLQDYQPEVFEFQTLIENTQVAILIFQDRQICYANPMTKILTGYNQDELLSSTNLGSQLQLEQQIQILASDDPKDKRSDTPNKEVKLLTKNARECWLDCSFRLVNFGKKTATLITAIDITKHKQAEQKIQQILHQEKKLVSMVSHELRTPLNIISFSSNLLKRYGEGWKPSKVREYLERMQRGVDTLSLLIDEWLILGKIERGNLKCEPELLKIKQFCRNLLSDLQLCSGDSQQINFTHQGDNSSVILDRRILQLILTNLLENAIKYSPEGKAIKLIVVSNRQEVSFKIEDQGIGISPKDLKQLFEPFYRGANIDNIHGHGLGLAIVKKLVELSGGQINVTSQIGKGTEFIISFPQPA